MKLSEAMETTSPKDNPSSKDKADHGELRSVRVEAAENGFTVSVEFEPKKTGKKNEPSSYVPPEQYVFESSKDAARFVQETLNDHEDYEDKEK